MEGSDFLPAHLHFLVLSARKEIGKKFLIIILDTQDQYPKTTIVELVEFCKCKLRSNLLRYTQHAIWQIELKCQSILLTGHNLLFCLMKKIV